jgi:toxin ParE1/3/4
VKAILWAQRPVAASAVKDLEEIRFWYADQTVPAIGEKFIREIIAQAERSADFPESGRMVPEFGKANLRDIILAPFRIICRLDKSRVRIVRVWHSEGLLKMP